MPLVEDQGLGVMVWSPLAGGLLTGKFARDGKGPESARRAAFDFPPVDKGPRLRRRRRDAADRRERTAASVARVALAWLLGAQGRDERHRRRQDDRAARRQSRRRQFALTEDELVTLDAVSALKAEYPGWMLARQSEGRVPGAK